MIRVNRQSLLQVLESVQAGLSRRDIVEQSSSFVFKDGWAITLNGEVSCRMLSHLPKEFKGAVASIPLLGMLRQLPEEEILLDADENALIIKGQGRKTHIKMESEILLPVDSIEKPTGWKKLPEGFSDAVTLVHECASDDQSTQILTFLNLTPKWIEATDRFQLARYKIAMPIDKPTLVRKSSIKHILAHDMQEMSLTDSWMHLRNSVGLYYSLLRFNENYPDLSELLRIEGTCKARFPKGLAEAAKRAATFSIENPDIDHVHVEIRKDKLRIEGVGLTGRHEEYSNMLYNGPSIRFAIAPKLLEEIVKRYNDCEINKNALYVKGETWIYANSLEAVGGKENPIGESDE